MTEFEITCCRIVCRGEFLTQFEGVAGPSEFDGCQKGADSIALAEHRSRNSVDPALVFLFQHEGYDYPCVSVQTFMAYDILSVNVTN